MARIRSIKPQFFLNDEIAELPPLDRIIYIGLWCQADREGRLEDRIKRLKAEILPYDDYDLDVALNRLQKNKFIQRYNKKGVNYIQVLNFLKHQCPNVKEHPSTIPAPYKNRTSTPRLRKGKEGKGRERKGDEINFNLIWEQYPNKDGKKDAERHFEATVHSIENWVAIRTALKNYLNHLKLNTWKPPKNGSTWFNNWYDWVDWVEPERLDGEITEEQKQEKSKKDKEERERQIEINKKAFLEREKNG